MESGGGGRSKTEKGKEEKYQVSGGGSGAIFNGGSASKPRSESIEAMQPRWSQKGPLCSGDATVSPAPLQERKAGSEF